MEQYLAIAELELSYYEEVIPFTLPRSFGEFTLNYTAQARPYIEAMANMYLEDDPDWERISVEELVKNPPPLETPDLPNTPLYMEFVLCTDNPTRRYNEANEKISLIEAFFRLFKPGYITVHLHLDTLWKLENGSPVKGDRFEGLDILEFLEARRSKPTGFSWTRHQSYDFSDTDLDNFVSFFDRHWTLVAGDQNPLSIAIRRFSESYERQTQTDRLVDLMVAMEAIFSEANETSYKIAVRSASFIYPPGEARAKAFETIRQLYNIRSDILHGRSSRELNVETVNLFEGYVRQSLVRFLDGIKSGDIILPSTKSGRFNTSQFDHFFLFRWQSFTEEKATE